MSFKIITIGREFGSGGRAIGEDVAKALGIKYYDHKISEIIAEELGLSEEYVADRGEYAPTKNIFSYAFVNRDMSGVALADKIYSAQERLILDLAEKDSCVLVGRCADAILSDRDDVMKVFIQGNTPEKIERIRRLYNKTEDEALKMIKEVDKKRSINYKYCTDLDWGSLRNYDMVLNSSSLGHQNCVDLIVKAFKHC